MSAEVPRTQSSDELEALAGAHDWPDYFRSVRRLVEREPVGALAPLNAAMRRASGLGHDVEGFRRLRIGILRNVTVEPFLPQVFGALLKRGVLASFWLGDYDVYERYALEPATQLPSGALDALLVHFDSDSLVGDARIHPPDDLEETVLHRLEGIVAGLLEGWDGMLLVSNLAPGPSDYLSPLTHQSRRSWLQRRRAINLGLLERWSDSPRVSIVDLDDAVGRFGASGAYDRRMYYTSRMPFTMPFASELGDLLARILVAAFESPRKCLVVDCDNTLWGGVLGEDGPSGLALGTSYPGVAYREFQLFLKALKAQGVLIAINSKNNEADVVDFVETSKEMVLRMDDVTAYRINWEDKVSNMRALAAEMNIGLDSLIFIDDSAVECALVRSMLPEVQVEQFPSDPLEVFTFLESFKGVERLWVTEDDLKRSESYRANVQREKLRQSAPSLDDFIRSLEITLEVHRQDRGALPRMSQLTQRTNQFNLTTRRYSVEDIEKFMDTGTAYRMRMTDRFTDYGIVGLALVRVEGSSAQIDTFLLSCRAFGRGVEGVLLAEVLGDLSAHGVEVVCARFVPTAKNAMTRDFYSDHGFDVLVDTDEERTFELRIGDDRSAPDTDLYRVERIGY